MQLVLVCGGRGQRLAASLPGIPKPLVEVDGRPLLDRLLAAIDGWHSVTGPPVVIVPMEPGAIPTLVRSRRPDAIFVPQREPDGIAGALLVALPHLTADALVVLGDLVLDGCFPAPWTGAPAVVVWRGAAREAVSRNFGVVVEGGAAMAFVEKPEDPGEMLCGIGVYLLPRRLIATFRDAPVNPATSERELTAALERAREQGERFAVLEFEGFYCNVNTEADRAAAEQHFRTAARRPGRT